MVLFPVGPNSIGRPMQEKTMPRSNYIGHSLKYFLSILL